MTEAQRLTQQAADIEAGDRLLYRAMRYCAKLAEDAQFGHPVGRVEPRLVSITRDYNTAYVVLIEARYRVTGNLYDHAEPPVL